MWFKSASTKSCISTNAPSARVPTPTPNRTNTNTTTTTNTSKNRERLAVQSRRPFDALARILAPESATILTPQEHREGSDLRGQPDHEGYHRLRLPEIKKREGYRDPADRCINQR